MKRLALLNDEQKYYLEISNALEQLIFNNDGSQIVNLDLPQESFYSGTVYRKLTFDYLFIDDLESDSDENGWFVTKQQIENKANKIITTNSWQSTTNNLEACKKFNAQSRTMEDSVNLIISFEAVNGIDINYLLKYTYKYVSKQIYKHTKFEQAEKMLSNLIKSFGKEEEIYAIVPSSYDLLYVNNVSLIELESNQKIYIEDIF